MNAVNIINLTGNPFDSDNLPGIDSSAKRNHLSIRVEPGPVVNMQIISEAELKFTSAIIGKEIDIFEPTLIILQNDSAQQIVLYFILNFYNYYQLDPRIWIQGKDGVYIDTHDFIIGTIKVREAVSTIQGDQLG